MRHIFIDFEMHPIAKEYKVEKSICSNEIIEFGAVMLDENYTEIDSFKSYVKPQYVNDVYTKISVLTGITKGMLIGAPKFEEVLTQFLEWSEIDREDITVYAWSNSDLMQLRREMKLKNIVVTGEIENLLSNWVDFQKDYSELVHAERILSLEKALSSIGQLFMGDMHDALYDARNTSELFTVTRNQEEFYKMLKPITDTINSCQDSVSTFTLGDLFDFSNCKLALA